MRGPRRRQGAAAPGLQSDLCPGGRHGPLQEDAGTHVSPAGRRREPPEEGKTGRRGRVSISGCIHIEIEFQLNCL